jgi:hypothetical protein
MKTKKKKRKKHTIERKMRMSYISGYNNGESRGQARLLFFFSFPWAHRPDCLFSSFWRPEYLFQKTYYLNIMEYECPKIAYLSLILKNVEQA